MRFYLVRVSSYGYRAYQCFTADSLSEAARRHIAAHVARKFAHAIVMRGPDGKRYSFEDAEAIVRTADFDGRLQAAAAEIAGWSPEKRASTQLQGGSPQ